MPSVSLTKWHTERLQALDELENAHRNVGGPGRGRRYATQQLNQAYALMASSHFQGFCRDLHSESSDYLATAITPLALQPTVVGAASDKQAR